MNPRILCISGRGPVETYRLGKGDFTIGSSSDNDLQLRGTSLARKECIIQFHRGGFVLKVLTQKSVFLNGKQISGTHELNHRDQIRIADAELTIVTRAADDVDSSGVQMEDLDLTFPEYAFSEGPLLNSLAAVSVNISHAYDQQALCDRIMRVIFEEIPADRVAILFFDRDREERQLQAKYGLDRSDPLKSVAVDKTTVFETLNSRLPARSSSPKNSSHFRTILAIPLSFAGSEGVIYAEAGKPDAFNGEHLQMLEMCGWIAEARMEYILYRQRQQQEPSPPFNSGKAGSLNFRQGVIEAKRRLIIEAFKQANGSYRKASELLDLHPNYMHRLLGVLGLTHLLEDH